MKLLVKKVSGVTTVTFIFSGDGEEHRYTLFDGDEAGAATVLRKILGHIDEDGSTEHDWEARATAIMNDTAPYEPQVHDVAELKIDPKWAETAKSGVSWDDEGGVDSLPIL